MAIMCKWGQTVIALNRALSPTVVMHFTHMVPRKEVFFFCVFFFLNTPIISVKIKIYWFTSLDIPKCTRRRGKFWVVGRNAINEQLLFKDQIPVKTV